MQSPILSFRVSTALLAAATQQADAAGLPVREWVRRLIERETGVQAGMVVGGLAHMSAAKRKKTARMGGKAKAAANMKK